MHDSYILHLYNIHTYMYNIHGTYTTYIRICTIYMVLIQVYPEYPSHKIKLKGFVKMIFTGDIVISFPVSDKVTIIQILFSPRYIKHTII